MSNSVNGFRGEYSFLSNFSKGKVVFEGLRYDYRENAFQAAKVCNDEKRESLLHVRPAVAKMFGKVCKLREYWEERKDRIMLLIVRDCFMRNKDMKRQLIDTGDMYLEETNDWGDKYWGVCKGEGENKLGEILMRVRDELNGKIKYEYVDQFLNSISKGGKYPLCRIGMSFMDTYLHKDGKFLAQGRDGKDFSITYEEIIAALFEDEFVGCTHECNTCLTPIC